MSGAPLKYIDHVYPTHRKFSKSLWNKIFELDFHFENGVQKLWGYAPKQNIFHSKLLFHKFLENFLCVVQAWSIYLKDAPGIACYATEKIGNVRHVKQIICQETWKSLDFWKSNFENGVEKLWSYASKNPIFHSKLFFASS